MFLILFFFFLSLSLAERPAYLPVSLLYDEHNREANIITNVNIGTPAKSYMLSIDFGVTDIVMFTDLARESISYTSEGNGSDVVQFGTVRFRPPVLVEVGNAASFRTCQSCQGVLGLARDSVVWRLWSEASFTPGLFLFGDMHPIFGSRLFGGMGCLFSISRCQALDTEYLCTAPAMQGNNNYNISISMYGKTILPFDMFTAYMEDKDLYTDQYILWNSLDLIIPHTEVNDSYLAPLTETETDFYNECAANFTLQLRGADMAIGNLGSLKRTLLIEPHTTYPDQADRFLINNSTLSWDNHIILGVQAWRSFAIHWDAVRQVIFLKEHNLYDNYSMIVCFLVAIINAIFIFWKLTAPAMSMLDKDDVRETFHLWQRDRMWHVIVRILGDLVVVASLILPSINAVLSEFTFVYVYTIMQTCVLGVIDLVCTLIGIFLGKRLRETPAPPLITHTWIRLNIVQNVCHETLLLTGMWILFAEKRVDTLGNSAATIFMGWLYYNLNLHAFITIFYIGYVHLRSRKQFGLGPGFMIFISIIFPLVYVTNSLIFWSFLYTFILTIMSQIAPDTTILICSTATLLLLCVSMFMTHLYIRKGILFSLMELRNKNEE